MPTACTIDACHRPAPGPARWRLAPDLLYPIARMLAFGAALACFSCERPSSQAELPNPQRSNEPLPSSKGTEKKPYQRDGIAVWYVVPAHSLARRRAGLDELTAAHNDLQLGTRVRVTHLTNGQSVVVRITDRGVTKKGVTIDLCKEAAERLGMTDAGEARVRIEELLEAEGGDAASGPEAATAHP